MGLDVRLQTARLYLSTDLREATGDFGGFVEAAFAGGVDILQVHQDDVDSERLVEALDLARTISYHYQGLVVVAGDAALAHKFNADVLHLSQGDIVARVARPQLHQWALIGRAVHEEEEIREAVGDQEVNYLSVGPAFSSSVGAGRGSGPELVRFAATFQPPGDVASKPWFASGGIDEDTIDAVIDAGARRVWVTRAITRAADAEAAARRLSAKLREAWNADDSMQALLSTIFKQGRDADPFIPVQQKPPGEATRSDAL